MSSEREMQKYKCHKEVWAVKIKSVEVVDNTCELDDQSGIITAEDEGYAPFSVSKEFMERHSPQVGGYYVFYEGGHVSYSPAEPFESGYTKINTSKVDEDLLVIAYGGDSIDEDLDAKVITLFKELGYSWLDSGYDLIINRRDLRFKKE